MHACGDDHLDADTVLKAQREVKRGRRTEPAGNGRRQESRRSADNGDAARRAREQRLAEVTAEAESTEARLAAIDGSFAAPRFFTDTPAPEVRALQAERAELEQRLERLMSEWERLESEVAAPT